MPASRPSSSTKPARSRADQNCTPPTDGLEVTSVSLGSKFPGGLVLVQDDENTDPDQPQNFKLLPWSTVESAIVGYAREVVPASLGASLRSCRPQKQRQNDCPDDPPSYPRDVGMGRLPLQDSLMEHHLKIVPAFAASRLIEINGPISWPRRRSNRSAA